MTDDQIDGLITALCECLSATTETNVDGSQANLVDGLFAIARAIEQLAHEVKYLGNGNALTQMGAIEAFGKHMGEKMDDLTAALQSLKGEENA